MSPKYSVVLPTLNGRQALQAALPAMLACPRRDVEWVISENRSDDDTYAYLAEVARRDARVRLMQPAARLNISDHLEFAYSHAQGQWLTHLGDDDLTVPWRFEALDRIITEQQPDVICGGFVRYVWPNYPDPARANSLDPKQRFTRGVELSTGLELARRMCNDRHVAPGGCWTVRREVVQKVRDRCGCFSSAQHVEFFAMRAAVCMAERVAITGLPLLIYGQHEKSSTSQAQLPRKLVKNKTWDWSVEDPNAYRFSPFQWKTYSTLSLDAALAVRENFSDLLGDVPVNWTYWVDAVYDEMMRLKRDGQLPAEVEAAFSEGIRELPVAGAAHWRLRKVGKALRGPLRLLEAGPKLVRRQFEPPLFDQANSFGWRRRIFGQDAGIFSIADVPNWLASHFAIEGAGLRKQVAA